MKSFREQVRPIVEIRSLPMGLTSPPKTTASQN